MLCLIVGSNRVEVCPLKKADYEKWFFRHRGQTYMIMPQNLVRLRYFDSEGRETREPEEAIIFPEGSTLAYDTAPECVSAYYQENVLPAIELARVVKGKFKGAGVLGSAYSLMRSLYPMATLLITAAIVGYALLTGGVRWPSVRGACCRGSARPRGRSRRSSSTPTPATPTSGRTGRSA